MSDGKADINADIGKRTGRPPKDESEKRVPLSLRINPELRKALEAAAKEENRSLTQLSEFALAAFLEGRKAGHAPKEVSPRASPTAAPMDQFSLPRVMAMLEAGFGRQIAALVCLQAYAMLLAELDSIAWSRDIAERTQQLPRVTAHRGSRELHRQLSGLWSFLHKSSPAHKAEQPWLVDDPYVFGQVAGAARHVLEMLAPEGNRSPRRPPRGINRAIAVEIMKSFGREAANSILDQILEDDRPSQLRYFDEPASRRALDAPGADLTRLKRGLGEAAVARLRQWLPADQSPDDEIVDPSE